MKQYLDLLRHVRDTGVNTGDRTGTGTRSVFGYQNRYDLSEGFPLVTTKKTFIRPIIHELLWFLAGDTNIKYLQENRVKIWDEWADENGDLGPVYGAQWRDFGGTKRIVDGNHDTVQYGIEGVDQIGDLIDEIKSNPTSRRLIVSGWNPSVLPDPSMSPSENASLGMQALPPCHTMFQFKCIPLTDRERVDGWYSMGGDLLPKHLPDYDAHGLPKYKLSCQLYQRSADVFLGVPFNIASYALLTEMVAQVCNMVPGEFIHTFGDVHIYNNHMEQVDLQLSRAPAALKLPRLKLNKDVDNIFDFTYGDISIEGYESHPAIKAPISV